MGPYRDSISLKKSPFFGPYTGSEAQLDLATVRYHALGAYAKSVYLVIDNIYQSTHQSLRVRSTSTWHERDIELDLIVVLEISILMLRVKSTRSRPDNGNDIVHILSTKGPAL